MLVPFLRSPFRRLQAAPRPVRGLAIGVFCALLVQGLFALGWLRGLERGTLDALFRLRGPHFGAEQIVLVMVDDATVARYNQWPLPRRAHADLVRTLKKAGAKTIAYDLLFSTGSSSPADDADFARACQAAGNVVQACVFHLAENSITPTPGTASGIAHDPDPRFGLDGSVQGNPASRIPSAVWMSAPLPGLLQSAPAIGHINIQPENDGVLRRIPHALAYHGRLYPSLALAAAAHYLGLQPSQVHVANSEFLLQDKYGFKHRLPLDAGGETWVNWAGGYRTFPTYSMLQVLSGEVPPSVFKGRIVMIGAIAQGTFEWRATPFSPAQPAVELQASALDNILLQRPITIAPNAVRFLLALLLATFTGALVAPRLDLGATFLLLGICLLSWLLALVCFSRNGLYLPFAPAILAAALTYSLAMAINYREEWEANWRADASVAALARGGALMISGRNRADLEEVIRSTACEALQADEIHLLLDGQHVTSPSIQAIAQAAEQAQSAVFYPPSRDGKPRPHSPKTEPLAQENKPSLNGGATWVAAPILMTGSATDDGNQVAGKRRAGGNHKPRGFLIAVGQSEGRPFTARDAGVMETLADQAALALESLESYEMLQSRVDLANRDLREAYSVLSSQTARFMAAVESMDDAFIICDAGHHVVFVNGPARAILQEFTPQLGASLPECFRAGGLPEAALLFEELEKSNSATHQEYAVGERVLSLQLTPLAETEKSDRTGAMLIVSDVTSQRELDRMKTDFVGFVAHELRSPLGVIMGYASLLQQSALQATDDPAAAMQAEVTGAIDRQCRRLNRLVNDLLDIARIEAGHALDLQKADIDLVALCERVLEMQRAAVTRPDISLSFECAAKSVSLFADSDRLEQVLINLLSNAVKYSPAGGAIVLRIAETAETVELTLSDTGMGMTREQAENLFQKFYRTPEAKAQGIQGTGLGLFLVKQFIEAHGATIAVESELGAGTTFRINFPRPAVS